MAKDVKKYFCIVVSEYKSGGSVGTLEAFDRCARGSHRHSIDLGALHAKLVVIVSFEIKSREIGRPAPRLYSSSDVGVGADKRTACHKAVNGSRV